MTEDYSSITQDVEKSFQKWFGDPVPPDISFFSPEILFPDEILVPGELEHSGHKAQRSRIDDLQKLSELFKFGFEGAVFLGTFVGFVITFLSVWGWYSKTWPNPIFLIFLAVVIGFIGGLYKGLIYKLRERVFYKHEL